MDDPSVTGKTFLYKALLSAVRSQYATALATASSRVAASLLSGGRTVHSRFKIPLEKVGEISCSVSKQSALGTLLKMYKLIIWDEAPMINQCAVEAVVKMLKDINDCNLHFGGKVIVLEVENMKAKLDPTSSDYLLRIGNGTEQQHSCNCIQLPSNIIVQFENEIKSLKTLVHYVFPNIKAYADNLHTMANRVILTSRNECVDHINKILLEQIPGEIFTYYSFDETINKSEQNFVVVIMLWP
ncbi:uncharacterized protein LOC111404415 [Olea europaea var. sylvestris]|uniref:uncharacterized protein LOC111404415 n=1 Tax=Olea europaea var. sylvestris TaxID=158386 RepID=UPI000C1CFFC0|nr:uncharacterized protein LOC111404415 [Olea europaea var. sylvestris]